MSPEDWQLIESIVESAFERPPADRKKLLDRACAGRPDIWREVTSLIEADEQADAFLEIPPLRLRSGADPTAEDLRPAPRGGIGPYRLLEEIGFGGWSRVYRARHEALERDVAIKIIDPGQRFGESAKTIEDISRRFRTERHILGHLQHASIARLLDGGETGGRLYFVMELIDGQAIDAHCAEAGLDVEARLRLFLRVLEAVSFAHERLVVHRDLKPSNILVTADGEPKLLDFGIAKVLEDSTLPSAVEATLTGWRPMTPSWAAPEQVRGETITTAADVYTLGLLLYLLLTGERPYSLDGLGPRDVEATICESVPMSPGRRLEESTRSTSLRPPDAAPSRLAGDLDAIVMTALAKRQSQRYRTVRELAADLERHLAGDTVSARPATWRYRTATFLRRHAWGVAVATAGVFVLLSFLVTLWWQSQRLEAERDQARIEFDRAEAVTDFLVQTFAEAHPARAPGRTVSAREILRRGVESIEQLDGQPALQSRLLATLGDVHAALGEGAESVVLLKRARRRAVASHGGESVEVAAIDHRLGAILLSIDHFSEAQEAIGRALARRRGLLGDGHPDTVTSRALFGRLRLYQGFWVEARELLLGSSSQFEELLGRSHPTTLDFLGDLASAHSSLGETDVAQEIIERRLETARDALGPKHPLVADSLLNLGQFGDAANRLSRTEEAAALLEEIYGPGHRRLARALAQLAELLMKTDAQRAFELAERAREIDLLEWGEGTWALSLDDATLSIASYELGDLEGATRFMLRAAHNAREGTPSTHVWRATVLVSAMGLLLDQGKNTEVPPLLEELRRVWPQLPHRTKAWAAVPEAVQTLLDLQDGSQAGKERLAEHGPTAVRLLHDGLLRQRIEEELTRHGIGTAAPAASREDPN